VGAGVAIPAGAAVIDLSAATVPGMIDAHVHVTPAVSWRKRTLRRLANARSI
jgi:imidazolonepropionase-like amidohydrolase